MQLENNYKKAEDFIRSAALQGVQLAVLPEYHLTNWVPHDPGFRDACRQWKTYLDKYRALAKECKIAIVPGTIIELHTDGTYDSTGWVDSDGDCERLLNVAYFIGDDGEILGKYVKKNLWGSVERLHLTSSAHDPHPVFDTPFGKVGMLVCWDLAFPEAFREMIAHGAKLIIIPTFWTLTDCSPEGLALNPTAELLFLDSMLTARCFENTCGQSKNRANLPSASLTQPSHHLCQRRRPARQGLCWDLAGVRPLPRTLGKVRQQRGRNGRGAARHGHRRGCRSQLPGPRRSCQGGVALRLPS